MFEKSKENEGRERKLSINNILTIKKIDIYVNEFYLMKGALLRCFLPLILLEKIDKISGSLFIFRMMFWFFDK